METADIYLEHTRWQRPILWSLGFHAGVCALIVGYAVAFPHGRGEAWGLGGGGDAMGATLVSNIPLPQTEQGQNVLANESKGLSQSVPQVQEKETEAIPIPDKDTKQQQKKQPSVNQAKNQQPPPEESNQIPYGQGGPVSGPYGTFSAAGAQGGFGFTGGGGDFGNRFAWYVKVVQQKVSQNWMKYEIDPSIREARRVYLTFDIRRDGSPGNVQIEQSSGIPSLDVSAMRAIQRIDTFGPLPPEYSGSSVSVEFWFDYKK